LNSYKIIKCKACLEFSIYCYGISSRCRKCEKRLKPEYGYTYLECETPLLAATALKEIKLKMAQRHKLYK